MSITCIEQGRAVRSLELLVEEGGKLKLADPPCGYTPRLLPEEIGRVLVALETQLQDPKEGKDSIRRMIDYSLNDRYIVARAEPEHAVHDVEGFTKPM